MYYGHLNNPNFIPTVIGITRKGKGYSVHLVNSTTNFNQNIPLSEFNTVLNKLRNGYSIKENVLISINSSNVNTFIFSEVKDRILKDIKEGICKII